MLSIDNRKLVFIALGLLVLSVSIASAGTFTGPSESFGAEPVDNPSFEIDGSQDEYNVITSQGAGTVTFDDSPTTGDTFNVWMNPNEDGNKYFFGREDSDNYHALEIERPFSSPNFRLVSVEDGDTRVVTEIDNNIEFGEWYRAEVTYTSSEIVVDWYDSDGSFMQTLSTDTAHEGPTSGFEAESSGESIAASEFPEDFTEIVEGPYTTAFTAENAETGVVELDLDSTEATIEWIDSDTDTVLESETVSSTGTVETDLSEYDTVDWKVEVGFSPDDDFWTAEVSSQLIFGSSDPVLSSAEPSGGKIVQETPVELSIDVEDADFDTAQGDEVDVTFVDESDGSTIGSETITENQTVTQTFEGVVAGTNHWSVTAEDDYGNEVTSDTFEFQTPEALELRDESSPDEFVTDEGEVEVRFFGRDTGEVVTRTTEDGTINMAGLPVDEPLIASTNLDGYYQRTIVIDSILDQQRLFLLPETEDASQVDWVLEDESGRFDATETVLFIERPIEIDGETEYRTIFGEEFGGTERTASQLATDDRYRLRIQNQEGNVRMLGSYVAAGGAQETLRVGSIGFPGLDDAGAAFSAFLDEEDGVLEYRFADEAALTEELAVEIYRDGEIVHESMVSGPVQTTRETVPLTDLNHEEGDSYRVEYEAQRDGTVVDGDRLLGDVPDIADEWGLDERLLNIFGMVTILASVGATAILSPRHSGIVGSSVAFGLSLIGVVAINALLLGFAFVVSGLFAMAGGGR